MKGFVEDIEALSVENLHFRRALYGKELPACRHGVEAHRRDRHGSA